jgi:hypothetical protein
MENALERACSCEEENGGYLRMLFFTHNAKNQLIIFPNKIIKN